MMRKIQLTQLTKTAAAFGIVSASTIDAWLLILDSGDFFDVPTSWYYTAPVLAWGVVGIPLSIHLADRLLSAANIKPGLITTTATAGTIASAPSRSIPYTNNGSRSAIMMQTAKFLGQTPAAQDPARAAKVSWQIPTGDSSIVIGEGELLAFLKLAGRRSKYQFSRRYWTQKRRPAMPRIRYDGTMKLLTNAGLIESRQHGASGWLVGNIKPHNAVSFLKYESIYRF